MDYTYILNGESLVIDSVKCTGCGICTEVCPHAVLAITEKKAVIIEKRRCMECGACSINCPFNAITVNKGVGCAAAIIWGLLTKKAPECACGSKKGTGCC